MGYHHELDDTLPRGGLLTNCIPFCHVPFHQPWEQNIDDDGDDDDCEEHVETPAICKRTFSINSLSKEIIDLREAFQQSRLQINSNRALSSVDISKLKSIPCVSITDASALQLDSRKINKSSKRIEDIDHFSSSSNYPMNTVSPPGMSILKTMELRRVREFYKSLQTDVITSSGLVNFYIGSSEQSQKSFLSNQTRIHTWSYKHTGVLVCLLDSGFGRRPKQLQLILADPNTAFPLWKEVISTHSRYTATKFFKGKQTYEPNYSRSVGACLNSLGRTTQPSSSHPFHYLRTTGQRSSVVGFCFDFENDACDFLTKIKLRIQYCDDEDDDDVDLTGRSSDWRVNLFKDKRKNSKKIKKKDISTPVFSTHLTSIIMTPC